MANARIYLNQSREGHIQMAFGSEPSVARELLKNNKYLILPPIQDWSGQGEEIAEEMFNLTNNPSRQEERITRYGNGPSVSTGDIVDVDGTLYLCCSVGWVRI